MFLRLGATTNQKGSVPLIIVGILLCFSSTILLWTNEGRTDLRSVAQEAAIVRANGDDAVVQGKLAAITGRLEVENPAGDADFGLYGSYLRLERHVEMYAWVESKDDDDYYKYEQEWTSSPQDSNSFAYPDGHTNPPMAVSPRTYYAVAGRVGTFTFDPERANLPATEDVALASDLSLPARARVLAGYIYIGRGAETRPVTGDLRVSYKAVSAGVIVTLYGQIQGASVEPYIEGKARLYGIWNGNHDEAMAAMHAAYIWQGWFGRIGGLIMMWIGLNLFLRPLNLLVSWIPVLGKIGQGLLLVVTFLIALALTGGIVLVSFIAHRWYLLAALILLLGGLGAYLVQRRREKDSVKKPGSVATGV